jgi:hypothetical protein
MKGQTLLLAAALVSMATTADAQATFSDLHDGARIRLRAPDVGVSPTTTAVVHSIAGDTLYLRALRNGPRVDSLRSLAIPVATIVRLDVSLGRASRSSRARKGALWGLAVYGMAAAAYIVRERSHCHGSECFGEGMAWVGIVAGAPLSAAVGGTVAAALPVERRRRIDLGGRKR